MPNKLMSDHAPIAGDVNSSRMHHEWVEVGKNKGLRWRTMTV